MDKMKNYLIYAVICVVAVIAILVGAWQEGLSTGRWWDPTDEKLESMGYGIRNIPISIGEWEGDTSTQREKMEDVVAREAGAHESLARAYKTSAIPKPVTINIISGLARKVAIHTPDACYRGAGFTIEGEIQSIPFQYLAHRPATASSPAAAVPMTGTFKTALFVRESPEGGKERQRVFWGWKGVGTGWITPELPRQRWRPTDPISKLYLSTSEASDDKFEENPAFEFAKVLLPELDKLLSGDYVPPEDFAVSGGKETVGAAGSQKSLTPKIEEKSPVPAEKKSDSPSVGYLPGLEDDILPETIVKPKSSILDDDLDDLPLLDI